MTTAPSIVLSRGALTRTVRHGRFVVRTPQCWWRPCIGLGPCVALERTYRIFSPRLPVPRSRWLRNRAGTPVAMVQRYIEGAQILRHLDCGTLVRSGAAESLLPVLEAIDMCYRETGWLPDIGGKAYLPWELYDVSRCDNLVLDRQGAWWLVDVGATALFHSRRWPPARLHLFLMRRALRLWIMTLRTAITAASQTPDTDKREDGRFDAPR